MIIQSCETKERTWTKKEKESQVAGAGGRRGVRSWAVLRAEQERRAGVGPDAAAASEAGSEGTAPSEPPPPISLPAAQVQPPPLRPPHLLSLRPGSQPPRCAGRHRACPPRPPGPPSPMLVSAEPPHGPLAPLGRTALSG